MKALFFNGKNANYVTDYPKPKATEDWSVVKIDIASVCNTDKEVLKGYKPNFKGIMGHEFIGTVVESSQTELIGKRVAGELNAGCGHCVYCTSGRENHCLSRKVPGLESMDGCFAEFMSIRTNLLHLVPDSLSLEKAVFVEPLAAAIEIAEQNHIKPNQNIAVIGDGRLSLMITEVLSLYGADITVIGHHEEKLELFKPYAKTTKECKEQAYELVVESSGSQSGIDSAIKIVRSRGRIILKSTYAGKKEINMSEFVVREISLSGSRCGPFEPALKLLQRGLITLPEIEIFSLEDWEKAFASKSFKVGFKF